MSNQDRKIIQLKNLSKIYYTDKIETRALYQLTLDVAEGEFLSISGPSGCGKSTLLSILGLLDSPSEGQYMLNDVDVSDLTASQRARIRNKEIGFIFQDFNLLGDMTVYENVELPMVYGKVPRNERKERVMSYLEKVDMTARAEHYPTQLSGGQQQRIAVARALAGSPSVLLADEPTGNLDSTNGDAVMNLLGELNAEGVTICIVTHDSRYATFANRLAHLLDGKIDSVVDQEPALRSAN